MTSSWNKEINQPITSQSSLPSPTPTPRPSPLLRFVLVVWNASAIKTQLPLRDLDGFKRTLFHWLVSSDLLVVMFFDKCRGAERLICIYTDKGIECLYWFGYALNLIVDIILQTFGSTNKNYMGVVLQRSKWLVICCRNYTAFLYPIHSRMDTHDWHSWKRVQVLLMWNTSGPFY